MRVVRHKKRGSLYTVIGEVTLQCGDDYKYMGSCDEQLDQQRWVLYQSLSDSEFHCRPKHEFEDGRFEEVKELRLP